MSLLDKISERVGGFIDEVFLPEDIRQSYELVQSAMLREEYSKAIQILEGVEKQRPGFERTHHLIGLCRLHLNDHPGALESLQRAIDIREEASNHFYAGVALEKLERFQESKVHLQRALELADKLPIAFDIHFALGRVYLGQGRADKAVKELRKALRLWPEQAEVSVVLAKALLARHDMQQARDILDSLDIEEPLFEQLLLMGRIDEARKNYSAANKAYQDALTKDEHSLEALIGVARTWIALSNHAHAHEYLLRALVVCKGDQRLEVLTLLGQINEAINNDQKAFDYYRTVLTDAPNHILALLGAGRLSLRNDLLAIARDYFQRVIDATALVNEQLSTHHQALLGMARAYLADEDYLTARRFVENLTHAGQPHKIEALYILGKSYLGVGEPAQAVIALQEALQESQLLKETLPLVAEIEDTLTEAMRYLRPNWDMPHDLHNPSQLIEVLQNLRIYMVQDPGLTAYIPVVQQLLDAVDSPLNIAIVGEFNAGKSTLVNAILGEDVVPTGVLPTTAHPCIMRYGSRKAARVVRADKTFQEVNFAQARQQMKDQADQIELLEYLYPHPQLRSVHFWDTPGFNALDERHEESATWALNKADAVIWVLDANQVLSQSEFDRIESLPDSQERLIVLINKIDRLGEGKHRQSMVEELLEYVDDHIGHQIAGCFAISALEALQEVKAHDAAQIVDAASYRTQEFHAFWQFLDERILQRSGRMKILEGRRQLYQLVDALQSFQANLQNDYSVITDELEQLSAWIDTKSQKICHPKAKQESDDIADRLDFLLLTLEREIAEAIKPGRNWLNRAQLSEEDRDFALHLMMERTTTILEQSMQRITAEINVIETQLSQQVTALLPKVPKNHHRTLTVRFDGFFDETRMLHSLLKERVYGQLKALAMGQIKGAGPAVLAQVDISSGMLELAYKQALRTLLPDPRTELQGQLEQWLEEFFAAAKRFCLRLTRDFSLRRLEATYRYDFTALLSGR